ncbi:GtrA family protein [Paraburkholderia sp. SUR17]|uniref:GtrA family protein n=1 Tax=Paraburkholderia sp. SUR17 TaxID=3034358 RepID=UPI002407CAB1|nr:GtrA family protein [Paraburkholderia sp. SUR17]WEY37853.1 GtrA family protein [Paraburkholderia sp. SUR17]
MSAPAPQLSRAQIVYWYAFFAALSIAANLGVQTIAYRVYLAAAGWLADADLFCTAASSPCAAWAVPFSVCAGTGMGLVVKYLLDKTWIFRYEHRNAAHGARTFVLYVVMGIGTTLVFWLFEFGAQALFHTEPARLAGGALGLVAGYVAKYRLDKRFVFA